MAKIKVTNPKYVIDAHLKTNYFKLRNTGGPKGDKGDKGDTGATGPEGPQGATGATGRAATVAIGTTQTLNPGQSAFVNNVGTNNDAIFNFGIPQGDKGDKGDTGATGATGQAATVTVGTTTTLAAGSDATVNNSGSTSAAVLNFGIPKGDKGDTGEKGDTGGVRSEYVTELPASGQENTYYLTGDTATIGTASGESFQVTNNDNTGQVLLTQLDGNATQQTYSGKNLIPLETADLTNSGARYQNFKIGLPAGTYTISYDITDISLDSNQSISVYMALIGAGGSGTNVDVDISGTITSTTSAHKTYTFTTTAASDISSNSNIRLTQTSWDNGARCKLSNIQIEAGSTATAYEPYVGGTASPNPDYPQAIETVTGGQTIEITGKNLFDMDAFLTAGGATYTKNGNVFSLTDMGNLYALPQPLNLIDGETYTFSQVLQTQSSTNVRFDILKNGSVYASCYADQPANLVKTFTADSSTYTIRLNYSTRVYPVLFNSPMLEKSATKTDYEPYQGQSYEINLGKNLLDVSNVNTGPGSNGLTMTANSDGSLTWAGTTTSTWAILTTYTTVNLKAGTYTLSIDKTLAYRFYVEAVLEDSTTQNMIIEAGQTSKTVTFAKGIKQIRLDLANFTNGQAYNETVKAQLEQSATPTDFAPYFTPIELAKIGTYQDYIWNDGGVWKIHKEVGKVVLDGSESWTAQASNTGYMYRLYHVGVGSIASSSMSNLMSDYFTPTTGANIYNVTSGGYMAQLTVVDYIRFNIGDTTNKLADFKTWLGSHNATVYYQLATATDTEITVDTLLAQLNTISELYGGVNNISLVPSAGAQGTITVKYTTWDKNNRYDVYIWNGTIGDFQIIHSGGGNN